MRRGKPQQEIYRPGSGPLRKSNSGIEEPESNTNKFRSHQNESRYRDDWNSAAISEMNSSQKKSRKPEQQLYVPRPVANAREMSQESDRHSHINGTPDHAFGGRSKRYSNRRRGEDFQDEWQDSRVNRQFRQGSEPRGVSNGTGPPSRMRDTRSVEPSAPMGRNYGGGGGGGGGGGEKSYMKPPSGRRHSAIGLESDKRQQQHKPLNVDKLPPRLRKKYLEENNLTQSPLDDTWNGSSMTFQGNNNFQDSYSTIPGRHQNYQQNQQYPNMGYSTLPNRSRGRGRFNRDPDYGSRSRTPDLGVSSPCSSRPPTPSDHRTRSNDTLNNRPQSPYQSRQYDHRNVPDRHYKKNLYKDNINVSRDFRNSQGDKHSVPTATRREEENVDNHPVNVSSAVDKVRAGRLAPSDDTILDWSEEVELNDRLEAEAALSDTLTRSSSVSSFTELTLKPLGSNSTSTASTAPSTNWKKSKRRSGRKSKRRSESRTRDSSLDNSSRGKSGSTNQIDDAGFKVPEIPYGRRNRRQSRDRRDTSYDRQSRNNSRESSFDRSNRRNSTDDHENWREEIIRSRKNSERDVSDRSTRNSEREVERLAGKVAGVLLLSAKKQPPERPVDQPKYPDVRQPPAQQKILFDHHNPNKPIVVKSPNSRVNSVPGFSGDGNESVPTLPPPQMYTTDQYGNVMPGWYNERSEAFQSSRYPNLIKDLKRADSELQYILNAGLILINWSTAEPLRDFVKEALKYLLCKDLKFCQKENVDYHLWKIIYHNIIEVTRKAISHDTSNRDQYKGFLLYLIDEGTSFFEGLISCLEETYEFKLSDYLGNNNPLQPKGQGFVGLALVAVQKLLIFLGDLGRYKEMVNESSNYGKCRQWYIKAHEVNPKNGKPYNQLALLAVYSKRKLDAVYYYMRSLMSSNPVPSAKEYLVALYDDNRKKYEQGERKRREERLERAKQHMKQKESEDQTPGSLRHETWIRPDGGKRVHRTTQTIQEQRDSEEEDLAALSSVDVNKRFVTTYLHVHGKLITKIGMESFQEAAMQMLKEFRALLQHSPVPLPCNRFLQLLALNMFAIESTQLKDPKLKLQAGYRSELQERALVVSLQMFNLILERCVSLLQENGRDQIGSLQQDVHVLLPAVKIWCDWMLCHSSIWNPPPSTQDFMVGAPGDAWSRLAILMNLLERLDHSNSSVLVSEHQEGYELVKLPEDYVLNGFTPLMVNEPDVRYAPKDLDVELAQFSLRMSKLLFFGTVFLCGLEPPVLKLEIEDDFREYVSVVNTSNSRNSPLQQQDLVPLTDDVLLESVSDEDDNDADKNDSVEDASSEVRDLLTRKVELEKTHRLQELRKQRVQKILSQAVVSVHIEVRPKYLIPDTNCFIDHLDRIMMITTSHVYTLMVPIIVLSELEGLSRGGKSPVPTARSTLDPQHVLKVAEAAKYALQYFKNRPASVKCVTTKGAVLSSTTFTTEDDSMLDSTFKNDDKILATCLALSKGHKEQTDEGEPKKLVSEVVLLTEDRNLRVKALARDVPVRELRDFMQWAGLG